MEAYGKMVAKERLIQWFERNSVIIEATEDEFFSKELFDCFHVDVEKSTIAFRFSNPKLKYNNKFFADSYERFASAYATLNDKMEPDCVAVYEDAPFHVLSSHPIRTGDYPIICKGVRKESDFLASSSASTIDIIPSAQEVGSRCAFC